MKKVLIIGGSTDIGISLAIKGKPQLIASTNE